MFTMYEWTDPPKDLPARLRAARAYAGISQGEMADQLGVSRTSIYYWERGDLPRAHALRGVIESYVDVTGIDRRWFEVSRIDLLAFIQGHQSDRPASTARAAQKARRAKRAIRRRSPSSDPVDDETAERRAGGS